MELVVAIDVQSTVPLYRQVVDGIKDLISTGKLLTGSRLPSTRELSETLGISRFTACRAYEELHRLRFINTIVHVGTFVNAKQPVSVTESFQPTAEPSFPPPALSEYAQRMLEREVSIPAADSDDCHSGCVLPTARWHAAVAQVRAAYESVQIDVEPFGSRYLRESLSLYAMRARGIECQPECIALFGNTQTALDFIVKALVNAGDQCAVENPGYPGARRALSAHNAHILSIPVDAKGMCIDTLRNVVNVRMVYMTPTRQDPTGVALAPERRRELLKWAEETRALIIEDDYDGDFRFGEKVVLPLRASDSKGNVIFISSFAAALHPLTNLAYVVFPPQLVPAMTALRALSERHFYSLEHDALARLINDGAFERSVRRARALFARRRQLLLAALNHRLERQVRITAASSGTSLLLRFAENFNPEEINKAASLCQLRLNSTQNHYGSIAPPNEYLLSFALLEEESIELRVERFAALLLQRQSTSSFPILGQRQSLEQSGECIGEATADPAAPLQFS